MNKAYDQIQEEKRRLLRDTGSVSWLETII